MTLYVLGSSSKGNGYILTSDTGERLVLECGIKLDKLKQAIDFDIAGIAGVLVTHEHGDHAKYIHEYAGAGLDIYASEGTINAVLPAGYKTHRFNQISPLSGIKIGSFKVLPFDVQHDAAQPLGFLINHPECGNLLFVTDAMEVGYNFPDLNNILIEANYSEEILQASELRGGGVQVVRDRVRQSHMSIETCLCMLSETDLSKVNNIVLIHLSDRNSDARKFQSQIAYATGKTVTIADADTRINLNITPF